MPYLLLCLSFPKFSLYLFFLWSSFCVLASLESFLSLLRFSIFIQFLCEIRISLGLPFWFDYRINLHLTHELGRLFFWEPWLLSYFLNKVKILRTFLVLTLTPLTVILFCFLQTRATFPTLPLSFPAITFTISPLRMVHFLKGIWGFLPGLD